MTDDAKGNGVPAEAMTDPDSRPPAAKGAFRPPIPVAKRLNRNALTVAAVLAGVTVLTVIGVTKPSPAGSGLSVVAGDANPGAAVPAHPAFLDQPPRITAHPTSSDSVIRDVTSGGPRSTLQSQMARGSAATRLPSEPATRNAANSRVSDPLAAADAAGALAGTVATSATGTDPSGQGEYNGYGAIPNAGGAIGARAQAYQAALTSSVFTADPGHDPGSAGVSGGRGIYGAGQSIDPALPSMAPGIPTAARAVSTSMPPLALSPVSWSGGGGGGGGGGTAAHLDSAGSPFTLWAGTLIPGLLITGLNSDLPGEVVGQMSRDVYDSRTQQILLLPKGSRLIGTYDNRSVRTGRIIVGWTRLLLPDGRSLTLPRLIATDERGQAGLHDQVDEHYAKIYGAAVMTSAITAGIQLSQPQQAALYAAPTPGQVAAGALGQNIGDVSLETARRGLDIPPTIVIRPGQPFNVFLAGDIAFDGPYEPISSSTTP